MISPPIFFASSTERAVFPDAVGPVPEDALTASASGLDPDISVAYARWQVPRVAAARGVPAAELEAMIAAATMTAGTSGLATQAGLLPGDVIVGIGTDPVTSFGEFKARIDATPAGAFVPLKVMRGNATLFLPLPVAK